MTNGDKRLVLTCYITFLTNRKQYARVENVVSSMCKTNTGAPQGCVIQPGCMIDKYDDGTFILGNIKDGDESFYRQEVSDAVIWCKQHHLVLNTSKTTQH